MAVEAEVDMAVEAEVDLAVEAVATGVVVVAATAEAEVDMAAEAVRMANDAQAPAAGRIAVMVPATIATAVVTGVTTTDAVGAAVVLPRGEETISPDMAAPRVESSLEAGIAELPAG